MALGTQPCRQRWPQSRQWEAELPNQSAIGLHTRLGSSLDVFYLYINVSLLGYQSQRCSTTPRPSNGPARAKKLTSAALQAKPRGQCKSESKPEQFKPLAHIVPGKCTRSSSNLSCRLTGTNLLRHCLHLPIRGIAHLRVLRVVLAVSPLQSVDAGQSLLEFRLLPAE